MTHPPAVPAIDTELLALLTSMPEAPPLNSQTLPMIRPYASMPAETALAGYDVEREDLTIESFDGAEIAATVLKPLNAGLPVGTAPCIYWVHGGGMIMGDQYSQIDIPLEWLARFGAVVVSVNYRLAPEHSGVTLVEDCYAGLQWTAAHAYDLGIDTDKLIIAGTSAGGGLAAGAALLARDRNGPRLAAQVLICPMLDHRNDTTSAFQFDGPAVWSREANAFGWRSVLAGIEGEVPGHVSPAVARDLSGLPPTYIDAGSAEVFRDEDVEYASRIWAGGGQAELHVWAGGFHGFDALFPHAALAQAARATRTDWLERTLGAVAAEVPVG
jgi:acetyl esterase/lipase